MAPNSINKNKQIFAELVKTLVSVIEQKDEFIRGHSSRVATLGVQLAKWLNLPKQHADQIYLAGLLHDIGMVAIPIEIIHKTENLTDGDRALIQKHPTIAVNVLSNMSILKNALPLIRHHHESFDGSGYPGGLKEAAIPFGARILCIADSYDAMSSARPHRPALPREAALNELKTRAGAQYDPDLIGPFIACIQSAQVKSAPRPSPATSGQAADESAGPPKKKKAPETVDEIIADIIERFQRGEIDLPVLPKVVQEIEKVMNEPNSDTEDLAAVIEKDAVISVRLISVANSPVYRGTDKITTIKQAVPRLGMKETQNIINAIATKNLYTAKNPETAAIMEKLWIHALATAYGARSIARKAGVTEADKLFLMGLIHDIGKVLLIKALAEYDQCAGLAASDILTAVHEPHQKFGGIILQHWEFTPEYIRVAEMHDTQKLFPSTKKEVLVVHLANLLTRTIGFSPIDDDWLDLPDVESAKLLELSASDLDGASGDVKQIIETSATIF